MPWVPLSCCGCSVKSHDGKGVHYCGDFAGFLTHNCVNIICCHCCRELILLVLFEIKMKPGAKLFQLCYLFKLKLVNELTDSPPRWCRHRNNSASANDVKDGPFYLKSRSISTLLHQISPLLIYACIECFRDYVISSLSTCDNKRVFASWLHHFCNNIRKRTALGQICYPFSLAWACLECLLGVLFVETFALAVRIAFGALPRDCSWPCDFHPGGPPIYYCTQNEWLDMLYLAYMPFRLMFCDDMDWS